MMFQANCNALFTLVCCFPPIEYAFSEDTFVVGDGGSRFLYKSDSSNNITNPPYPTCSAVALLFARDRNKPLSEFISSFWHFQQILSAYIRYDITRTVISIWWCLFRVLKTRFWIYISKSSSTSGFEIWSKKPPAQHL